MSDRILQINSLLQKKLAEIFSRELEFPIEFFVTIVNVSTAPDLKTACARISVLPFNKSQDALAFIIRHKGLIQKELGKVIKMKFTPKIHFRIDDTQERVSTINEIIDQANN